MTSERLIEVTTPILDACKMVATVDAGTVKIWDKKRMQVGHIAADGQVYERRLGRQNLLGALLKRQLTEAIDAARLATEPVSDNAEIFRLTPIS